MAMPRLVNQEEAVKLEYRTQKNPTKVNGNPKENENHRTKVNLAIICWMRDSPYWELHIIFWVVRIKKYQRRTYLFHVSKFCSHSIVIKNLPAKFLERLLWLNVNRTSSETVTHILLISDGDLLLTVQINISNLQLQPKSKGEFRFPVFAHWRHKQVTFRTAVGNVVVVLHCCESMAKQWSCSDSWLT